MQIYRTKAENDRRASQRDFLDKHYIALYVQDFALPEPRTEMAKVIPAMLAKHRTDLTYRTLCALPRITFAITVSRFRQGVQNLHGIVHVMLV